MSLRTHTYGKIIYPLYHCLKRDGVNRALRTALFNEKLSAGMLKSLQLRKLRSLLEFATIHVPYYEKCRLATGMTGDTLATPEGFRSWPILTKAILREQTDALVSTKLNGNRLIPSSTSGSTGEATYFFLDTRSDAFRKAIVIRNAEWAGIRNGDKLVRLWGARRDFATAHHPILQSLRSKVMGSRVFDSTDLSDERLAQYVLEIKRIEPELMVSYPGPLEILASYCRDRNIEFASLKAIITSAETLWPHQRALAESVFGVKIYNRYGSREFGDIAHECHVGNGLHVNSDRVYIEVLDPSGVPCPPGETGELFITDLDNYGMPMIRYRIGDLGAWSTDADCTCGRPFPLLARVEGRSLDVVKTADGKRVGGTFWTILLKSRPGLRQIQVVQDSIAGVRIHYIPEANPPSQASLDYFKHEINKTCGRDFKVEFVELSHMELGPTGKHRLIVSNIRDI